MQCEVQHIPGARNASEKNAWSATLARANHGHEPVPMVHVNVQHEEGRAGARQVGAQAGRSMQRRRAPLDARS
eukprot:600517-Lingulodinium_polyedra.AAC.1